MASINGFTTAQLNKVVKENFPTLIQKVFKQQSEFMDMVVSDLKRSVTEKDLRWKIYTDPTPGFKSYSEDDPIGIDRTDLGSKYETASLNWKLIGQPIKVSGLAQAVSTSENSIINALDEEIKNATDQFGAGLNKMLLSDGEGNLNGVNPSLSNTGKDVTGIQAAIDDGTNVPVYAGIDRGTAAWWRSYVLENPISSGTPRPISEQLFNQVKNEMRSRSSKWDLILCSPEVEDAYAAIFTPYRRVNTDQGNTGAPSYGGGYGSVAYNGQKLLSITDYEQYRIDLITKSDLELCILLETTMEDRDAGNQDGNVMFLKSYLQMKYANPWRAASIRDIQIAA